MVELSEERSLPPKAPELGELIGPLVHSGVEFVLIGGMAGIAHGSTYPSYDLDVVYSRSKANITRLVAALETIGVRLRGAPADLPFLLDARTIENGANFTFETRFGDFDILADVAGIKSFEELSSGAQEQEIAGYPVRVASLDHLISMKRAANRDKDKLMVNEYIVIADEQKKLARKKEEGEG
jgi:predicted nucleotidyltransferase